MRHRGVVSCSFLLVALAAPPGRTQPSTEETISDPAQLLELGVQLRREQQDARALAVFQRAYALEPSPRARAQVALAQQALGDWVDAEANLLAALALDDPWISANRGPLERALEVVRDALATLSIDSSLPGAEVYLNRRFLGRTPLYGLRLSAGDYDIELKHAAADAVKGRLTLAARTHVQRHVEFVIRAPQPEKQPTPALSSVPERRTEASSLQKSTDVRLVTAYSMLSAAAVMLGGGIAAHVVRESNVARYNDDSRCEVPGKLRDEVCGSYRGRAETASQLSSLAYIASGALTAAGVGLFAVVHFDGDASSRAVPGGTRGSLGMRIAGRF